jgi:glycosyltransferase involved in cell wall biosynthesis
LTSLNIVEICTGYPPDRTGGAEQVVETIREGLEAEGHNVTILTRFWKRNLFDPKVIQIPTPKSELKGYLMWALQARRKLVGLKPDLIHCHGLEGALLSILTLARGFPRIVHVHNSLTREGGYLNSLVHWFGLWAFELGIILADIVVVPTEVVKHDLLRHLPWIRSSKIVVVPNPVTQPKPVSRSDLEALRNQLNLDGRKVILYFGKIKRTKGLEEICRAYEAMKQKKNAALVIVGAPTATDRFLESLKSSYIDVIFTGFVPDPTPFYGIADIFCIYTSGFEGGETFAISLAEAMYNGVPVVCADNSIFREVTGGNAIFVDPANPAALADAFDLAVMNYESLARMAEDAQRIALERYTPDLFARRIAFVYMGAVNRLRPQAR